MTNYLSVLLGDLLVKTIIVGVVLVAMKFFWEGQFILSVALVVPLLFFLYLVGSDATLLE